MRQLLFPLAVVFVLCACGALNSEEENEEQQATSFSSVFCNQRPVIRTAGGKHSVSFSAGDALLEIDPGKTLRYLDWGSLSSNSGSAEYTAPIFVPETRKIEVLGSSGGALGRCGIYLLDSATFGVPDDGQVVGIPISIYKLSANVTSMPGLSGMTPSETNALYQLNVTDSTQPIPGVTKELAAAAFAYEVKGTIQVDSPGDYQITMNASNARGTLDATVLTNNVAATVNLTQGKHTISILGYKNANQNMGVRLRWAKRLTTTTFETPVLVPAAAFDR